MSVSLEPVDAPETVESETNPTPTQIEESESNPTIKEIRPDEAREGIPIRLTDFDTRVRSQGGENPVEAPESVPTISTTCERSVRSQGSENPVEAREGIPMVCTDFKTSIKSKGDEILSKSAAAQERKYQRNPKHQKRHPRKPFA